ncbi:MAG: hypothetical protein Hens3KO_20380 [Henriciella sp.]
MHIDFSHTDERLDQITTIEIGSERNPVLIFDSFLDDPDWAIHDACNSFFLKGGTVYPGVRGPLGIDFESLFYERCGLNIERVFNCKLAPKIDRCAFSLVTIPPSQLTLNQRVPHTDENEASYLAFILYLCDESHGGTHFFRHRPTGFERITQDRAPIYNAAVAEKMRAIEYQTSSSGYWSGEDEDYKLIFEAENRLNRLVVYSGSNLHSGDIRRPNALTEDPRTGRLTITGFLASTTNREAPNGGRTD